MDLKLLLNNNRRTPLYRQIYEQIREGILSGEYPAGERLPSSRKAARRNGLARVTMTKAYKQLEAEGYLISRIGSGTYVTHNLSFNLTLTGDGDTPYRPTFSRWGQRVLAGENKLSRSRGR